MENNISYGIHGIMVRQISPQQSDKRGTTSLVVTQMAVK